MKLSIAMIMKNEEKNLVRTLEAVKKLSKLIDLEIIIIDNGSTDRSVDIARKYTEKVFYEEWKDDFAYMRNISISKCTGDYILILDADEEIINIDHFSNFIKENKFDNYSSGVVNIINFYDNKEKSFEVGQKAKLKRLFKKNTIKYEGRIHEQPICYGKAIATDIDIIHYGYQNSDYELMEYKFKRNMNLLKEDLKNDPKNIYTNFQTAVSYHMHKDYDKALYYIEKAYKLVGFNYKKNIYVLDKYCSILYNKENYKKIIEIAEIGIKYENEFVDFYAYLAFSYYHEKQYKKVIENFEKVIKYKNFDISDKNISLTVNTKRLIDKLYIISIDSYRQLKKYEEGYKLILQINNDKLIKNNMELIINFLFEYDINEIKYIEKYIDNYNYEIVLNFIYRNKYKELIKDININELDGKLKELISIVNTEKVDKNLIETIKEIMLKNQKIYLYYLELIINNSNLELDFIKDIYDEKIVEKLTYIYSRKYKAIENSIEYINKLENKKFSDINIKINILKALILSNNLNIEKHKWAFNELVSLEYYLIINKYNIDFVKKNIDLINYEERFFFEIKEAFSYKYENKLEYITKLKNAIKKYESFSKSVKIILEDDYYIKNNIKELLEQVKNNIYILINKNHYQEAYKICNEVIEIINFDLEVYYIKYNLLNNFGHYKEANEILKNIILYGKSDEVNKILLSITFKMNERT